MENLNETMEGLGKEFENRLASLERKYLELVLENGGQMQDLAVVLDTLAGPVARLVEQVLRQDKDEHQALQLRVLCLAMAVQGLSIRDMLDVYERKTRPGFIWMIILMVTVPALGIILGVGGSNAPVWSTILVVSMLYLGLIRLPAWRKNVPLMAQHFENYSQACSQLGKDDKERQVAAKGLKSFRELQRLLAKANYRLEELPGLGELMERMTA